jgi:hypothetical protein
MRPMRRAMRLRSMPLRPLTRRPPVRPAILAAGGPKTAAT